MAARSPCAGELTMPTTPKHSDAAFPTRLEKYSWEISTVPYWFSMLIKTKNLHSICQRNVTKSRGVKFYHSIIL